MICVVRPLRAASLFTLIHRRRSRPQRLSTGQRQYATIARAGCRLPCGSNQALPEFQPRHLPWPVRLPRREPGVTAAFGGDVSYGRSRTD